MPASGPPNQASARSGSGTGPSPFFGPVRLLSKRHRFGLRVFPDTPSDVSADTTMPNSLVSQRRLRGCSGARLRNRTRQRATTRNSGSALQRRPSISERQWSRLPLGSRSARDEFDISHLGCPEDIERRRHSVARRFEPAIASWIPVRHRAGNWSRSSRNQDGDMWVPSRAPHKRARCKPMLHVCL